MCGLLTGSFLPDDLTQTLRTLVRHRKSLLKDSSHYLLRMQEELEMMNIKIHAVLSRILSQTGLAIVEAIIAGERNPENFLRFVHKRVKADINTIVQSLQANWRSELLFLLERCYNMHKFIQQQVRILDQQIESTLQSFFACVNDCLIEEAQPLNIKTKAKNHPEFNTHEYLNKIHGVNVLDIYGVSDNAGLEILAETGTDLSKWPTEKHLVSWLNLCPNKKITGGKLINSQLLKKKANAASQAFRYAANGLQRSDHWLAHYFSRMKAKGGNKYAILATSRKLATIYYKMVRFKETFKPFDNVEYKLRFQRTRIVYLERTLARLKSELA